jgi:hypothetical protein
MVDADTRRFTVAVFQDIAWARRGIDALVRAGFSLDSLTILARESDEAGALIDQALGPSSRRFELASVGPVVAKGPLLEALDGTAGDLAKLGLAATMRRAGFQPLDGRIYDTLTGRGGVLVAIQSDPRAADALAILHSYGGGNAAIGAWAGRV